MYGLFRGKLRCQPWQSRPAVPFPTPLWKTHERAHMDAFGFENYCFRNKMTTATEGSDSLLGVPAWNDVRLILEF